MRAAEDEEPLENYPDWQRERYMTSKKNGMNSKKKS
jgi:hypothetical protein